MSRDRCFFGSWRIVVIVTFGFLTLARGQANVSAQSEGNDCGTTALYYLLAIEGVPRTLDEIRSASPRPDRHGFSFRELVESARHLGLELSGVRVRERFRAPDRPMLAFLGRPEHGHYIVVRPVGHTGHLVQVFDGREAPVVLDMERFSDIEGWTGLALIPSRGLFFWDDPKTVVPLLALLTAISFLGIWRIGNRIPGPWITPRFSDRDMDAERSSSRSRTR